MKGLALILATAMLVFTMTACGRSADKGGTAADTRPQTNGTVADNSAGSNRVGPNGVNGNGTTNGTHNSVGGDIGNAMDDVANGIGNAMDNMTGRNPAMDGEVTYGQMLNRGRIAR